MAHDTRAGGGLLLAALSALSFGTSGALAKPLMADGWTAGSAVLARVAVAAVVLAVPTVLALRGRWHLLRANAGLVLAYGIVAVAGCQVAYFYAVAEMQVGVALLIEYTAPVAVVAWLWARHGQRPGLLTGVGAVVALGGLALVLDLVSGASLSAVGVGWALLAMLGAATYFVLSARPDTGLPPLALAGSGLAVGATTLAVLGLVGLLPMAAPAGRAVYGEVSVPWWGVVLALGIVAGAVAYVAGIGASRLLGSRVASFVALSEVLAALVWAWLLLGELPGPLQLVGGLLVLAGVVLVRLGETEVPASPLATSEDAPQHQH